MGFSSIDDYLNKTTNLGVAAALQTCHYEWNKVTGGSAYAASRWYDLNLCIGNPTAVSYGELITNAGPYNSGWGWTVGSNWTYTAGSPNGTFVHSATNTATISQSIPSLVNGVSYLVIFTVAWTSGSVTASLGGTSGTTRSAAGTYVESIVCGAGTAEIAFTPTSTAALSISKISVIYPLQSYQMIDTDTNVGAICHGDNVSPATKHIVNAGVVTTAATGVPGVFMLCDFLLAYPGINLNSSATQTLLNSNSIPRYTDGIGVKAVMVYSYGAPTAVSQGINISYTNTVPTTGQTMSSLVYNQGAYVDIVGHIPYSGVFGSGTANAYNFGPFMPLAAGDLGVTKIDSILLSAAGGAGTYATLLLVRPILELPITTAFVLSERNFMNQLPMMPRIYDGAFLGWLYFAGANTVGATSFYGYLDMAWGADDNSSSSSSSSA